MRLGKIGLKLQRTLIAGYSLTELPLFLQRNAQVIMGFDEIGLNLQRLLISTWTKLLPYFSTTYSLSF